MADVTPGRVRDLDASKTRPDELASPSHQNLHASKRQQRLPDGNPIPILLPTSRGPQNNSVAGAVKQTMQAAQKATEAHHNIISNLATAIDRCMERYTSPAEAAIAKELQQRVIWALNSSLERSPNSTPPASDSGSSQRSYAAVAQTLKNPPTTGRGHAKANGGKAAQNTLAPAKNIC